MQVLSVGQKYPFPISIKEGASAQFLFKGGSNLQIFLPDILPTEIKQIKNGKIKAGLIVDQPLILWIFKFGDISFECPFDARLIGKEDLDLPDIKNTQQRLSIFMSLVDSETHLIHVIKYFTLSPSLSIKFLSSVQDQLVNQEKNIMNIYQSYLDKPLEYLIEISNMDDCGI